MVSERGKDFRDTIGAFCDRREAGFVRIDERCAELKRIAENCVVGWLLAKQNRQNGPSWIDVDDHEGVHD